MILTSFLISRAELIRKALKVLEFVAENQALTPELIDTMWSCQPVRYPSPAILVSTFFVVRFIL